MIYPTPCDNPQYVRSITIQFQNCTAKEKANEFDTLRMDSSATPFLNN